MKVWRAHELGAPEDVLRLTPDEITERHRSDWRSLLAV